MQNAKQKAALFVLILISAGAAIRAGIALYNLHGSSAPGPSGAKSKAEETALEDKRFQPSARVLELLNGTDAVAPTLDRAFPCVFESLAESDPPQLGRCRLPTTHTGPVDRFEADLRYGHFILRQSDLYLNDIFDVPLTRTYNSGDFMHPNRVHAFGKNTNHPYDIAPVGTRSPYTEMELILEDGDFLHFPRVSEGTSYADAIYQHTETSTEFYKAVTTWNGDSWTTWRTDGLAIHFPEAYGSTSMAQSAAAEMRDADGNRLQLIRDEQRNLLEIRTPHKHWIKFKYDDQSRIVRAEDDQGHWAEYRYDGNGMLTDATLSSGQKRHYSYDGDLMTAIEDENHRVLLRNSYAGRILSGQDFGKGQVYAYSYAASPDGFYAESADVTLPDGTTTRIDLSSSIPAVIRNPH
jgi:YD repeat-containing protein